MARLGISRQQLRGAPQPFRRKSRLPSLQGLQPRFVEEASAIRCLRRRRFDELLCFLGPLPGEQLPKLLHYFAAT